MRRFECCGAQALNLLLISASDRTPLILHPPPQAGIIPSLPFSRCRTNTTRYIPLHPRLQYPRLPLRQRICILQLPSSGCTTPFQRAVLAVQTQQQGEQEEKHGAADHEADHGGDEGFVLEGVWCCDWGEGLGGSFG